MKENRIRTVRIESGSKSYLRHVHKCKNCENEILRSTSEEKTSTPYCKICIPKFRKNSLDLVSSETKCCNICKRHLHISKFLKKGNGQRGFSSACSKCTNIKSFGINSVEYEEMEIKQDYKCAICKKEEPANSRNSKITRGLAVDHDHKTGKVRGLLCTNCNIGLGQFKDNIELLNEAIQYLKQN